MNDDGTFANDDSYNFIPEINSTNSTNLTNSTSRLLQLNPITSNSTSSNSTSENIRPNNPLITIVNNFKHLKEDENCFIN